MLLEQLYALFKHALRLLVDSGAVELGRGNIISHIDMENCPGDYPVYSSSAARSGQIGTCGEFMFDEELITWSVDGGGRFFYRPRHRFSVTNVSGYLRIHSDSLDYRWLFYLLDFQHSRFTFDYTYKAHPSVIVDWYKIYDLPLSEQRRIAAILDAADEAIRASERVIAKLRQVKAGLLHDLLTLGVDARGRLRDPHVHPEQFKDSPLGRIPREWQVTQLTNVAFRITSGSRGWAAYYSSEGPLFLRIGNLTRDHINLRLDNIVHVQPPSGSEGSRTAVEAGDLLISVTADLGIIGVIPPDFGEAYVNQHIALVKLDLDKVNSRWVGTYLASASHGQMQFRRLNDMGAKAGMNLPTVGALFVPLPPLAEQTRIAAILDAHDARLRAEEAAVAKLRQVKAGLMEDLLTGKVRV